MSCFIIATSYNTSSVSRYFQALGKELSVQGQQVILIVDGNRSDLENRSGNPEIFTWPSKRPTSWLDAQFLHRLIKQFSPDCIIANFGSVNICTLLGWANRVPHRVVWYHTISSAIITDSQISSWKSAFQIQRKRFVYSLATHLIANSKAASANLQAIYKVQPTKCSVLPFLLSEQRLDVRKVVPYKIVCVGRLNRSKGQETLIRAASFLKQSVPTVQIEFVGDGPEMQNYKNLANELDVVENCHFLGAKPPAEVFEIMASAVVCVTTSRHEAYGLAVVEAQSVGTPVVASDVDGIRDLVVDGKTGFLIPPNDPEALGNKVLCLMKNELLRQEFSKNAKEHFYASFSLKNISHPASFLIQLTNPCK